MPDTSVATADTNCYPTQLAAMFILSAQEVPRALSCAREQNQAHNAAPHTAERNWPTKEGLASLTNCPEHISSNTHVQGVGLDMDRPWNHCWSLLLTAEVKEWCTEKFKDHTTLILTGVQSVGQFLAGDANITGNTIISP